MFIHKTLVRLQYLPFGLKIVMIFKLPAFTTKIRSSPSVTEINNSFKGHKEIFETMATPSVHEKYDPFRVDDAAENRI